MPANPLRATSEAPPPTDDVTSCSNTNTNYPFADVSPSSTPAVLLDTPQSSSTGSLSKKRFPISQDSTNSHASDVHIVECHYPPISRLPLAFQQVNALDEAVAGALSRTPNESSQNVGRSLQSDSNERIWEDSVRRPTLASSETLSSCRSSPSLSQSRALQMSSSLPPGSLSLDCARSSNVHRHSEPCYCSFADSSPKCAQGEFPDSALTPPGKESLEEEVFIKRASFPPAEGKCWGPLRSPRRASIDGIPSHSYRVSLNSHDIELHVHFHALDGDTSEDEKQSEQVKPMLPHPESLPGPSSTPEGTSTRTRKKKISFSSGIGEPSVYHALVVIFLEFFAWGLLTSPMIQVLKETFPDHTFLMNGIIMGIKGLLSFLSAPLIGALSDVWGRKFFLFITVFFTCLPIPFMKIDTWWYFALISISGVFAVTYSIVFAYVADVTDPAERHHAYGLVSATFAASLVISPALGAYLGKIHSNDLVVGLATAIAVLDIFFILVAVPESLPEKLRLASTWSSTQISWEQADPFTALVKVSKDRNILLISVTVFLSYLPEAGQLSCFFVYLQLVMDFGPELVATFIAMVGILSVIAQTALLGLLIRTLSNKKVISVGLFFELLQLMWYGFGSQKWMMWAAGVLAAISSITYPAISAYVSTHSDVDKQGVVQGIVTGMRGLCAGLGPAVFGFIFYLFHVDLNQESASSNSNLPASGGGTSFNNSNVTAHQGDHIQSISHQVPGPPFVFGAMMVLLALTVSAFIPEGLPNPKLRKSTGSELDIGYTREHKKKDSLDGTSQPLMNETGVL